MSDAWIRRATLGLLAALGAFCAWRIDPSYSITHFLPSEDRSKAVELWLSLIDSPVTRRMILAVSGGPERRSAARRLAEALRDHPEVAWVEAGFDDAALRGIYELYFERRFQLASDEPESEIHRMLEPEELARRAERLRLRLAGPDAPLASRLAPRDPIGLFERVALRVREARPLLSNADGSLESADGRHAIVLLGLRTSPFDSRRQAGLLGDIETEFARIGAELGGGLVLEQSGVNRIALSVERKIRTDVNFISAVSTSGVCALFLLFFRSLRQLLIALLVPLGGFVVAAAASLWLAAPVHGITIGFGFALIGVAIDYPIHLMTHHVHSPAGTSPRETLARIRWPLLASAATTALGFAMLAASSFPGLRPMGTFAAVGVLAALALTWVALPSFLGPGRGATRAQLALSAGLDRLAGLLVARRGLAIAVPAAYAVIAAVGLPRLHWEDDPAALTIADAELLAEAERVRALVTDADPERFVVASGADPESALALNDQIYLRLRHAVSDGQLGGFGSLHSVLWSRDLQRRNLAAFRAEPELGERVAAVFARSGFRPDAFQRFADEAARPEAPFLEPADLAGSPLARALDALMQLDGGWAVVTALRDVRSPAGIRAALGDLDGAHFVDQPQIVADLYRGYRRATLRMVALACGAMFLILWVRYRSPLRAFLAFLPSALVAFATLGLLGLCGIVVNVVSAVSLIVVLGMGVDYGVFSVDGSERPQDRGATLASLVLACLTTIFAFGTLALSAQPALRSFGLTTGTGIALALALSPSVLVLASRREAR